MIKASFKHLKSFKKTPFCELNMKKIIISFILFVCLILALAGLVAHRYFNREKSVDKTRTVYVDNVNNGFQLIRNGKPYKIQGAAGDSYFHELAAAGGNTIRVYDTINISNVLDEAQKNNLAVIVDIPIPKYDFRYNLYSSDEHNRKLIKNIGLLVKKHKDHPALLIWNLGNEINYPLFNWKEIFLKNSFIETFNKLIEIIHKEDPNHPVSTTLYNSNLKQYANIRINSPELDLLSYNVFGDIKNLFSKIDKFHFYFGACPFYISEFGSDGYWESKSTSWLAPIEPTSAKKSEQILNRYKIILENNHQSYLGALVFYWGNKFELTYTWFSLFRKEFKSEIIRDLKNSWGQSDNSPRIGLNYMLIDGLGTIDNVVFAPNERKTAELYFLDSAKKEEMKVEWEIFAEGWHYDEDDNRIRPKELLNLFLSFDGSRATFKIPEKEGPYRIFAYVYDNEGFFATTNTPFYVLNPK